MKTLTIRNLPPDLAAALEREASQRGESLNHTVISLLGQGLGVATTRSNGLGRLAGTWTKEEFERFEIAVAPFEQIDADLWE